MGLKEERRADGIFRNNIENRNEKANIQLNVRFVQLEGLEPSRA